MAAKYPLTNLASCPELTADKLRLVYKEMCYSRFHVERIVQECSKGNVKFAIWGAGEELHGAAQALAYDGMVNKDAFGLVGHYRSSGLLGTWARLQGYQDFHLDHMRQQLSRSTDPWTGGRQMTAHFCEPNLHILPVQSALGMQLGKAVGYAQGFKIRGVTDGLVVSVIGDGTTAEGDLHDAMNGGAVLELPLLIDITDNGVAISVKPEDGRGIKDFRLYAKAFGFEFFECDGNDFLGVYQTSQAAARYCMEQQRPAIFWIHSLARLNGHSNAGVYNFDWDAHDCLNDFGAALVDAGILSPDEIVRRNDVTDGKDYYRRHDLGTVAAECDAYVVKTLEIANSEPEPTAESIEEHIYAPFPEVVEPPSEGRQTVISLNGAIRAALRDILESKQMVWLYGQDIASRGGVMQATMGLWERFPDRVRDSPINEPLIVGSAVGFAMHDGATAIPEIQFSDYSLNTLHWLVYLGNLRWSYNARVSANVILRLPVEPLHGGAVYHSMCMEGFYGSIPGLVIVAPTTSRDFYGLLRTAAEYDGPVLVFESKGLYRLPLGDAFPGEPTDPKEIAELKRAIGFQGLIPDLPKDFRVPLGKAAVRREGRDLSIVTWGRTTMYCAEVAEKFAQEGIDVELIDLRTIVPPDMDTVLASARKTGRLLVVHEDRVFASIGREIQGAVLDATHNEGVIVRVLGQDPIPGIPQNVNLEHHIVVTPEKVERAARELLVLQHSAAASGAPVRASTPAAGNGEVVTIQEPARTQVLWTPSRYFVT